VNAAEYTALGVVLMKYRDAVDQVDASLLTAITICTEIDPFKALSLTVQRAAVLDALTVADVLLEGRDRKRAS
jgi:hypothetical protein